MHRRRPPRLEGPLVQKRRAGLAQSFRVLGIVNCGQTGKLPQSLRHQVRPPVQQLFKHTGHHPALGFGVFLPEEQV